MSTAGPNDSYWLLNVAPCALRYAYTLRSPLFAFCSLPSAYVAFTLLDLIR